LVIILYRQHIARYVHLIHVTQLVHCALYGFGDKEREREREKLVLLRQLHLITTWFMMHLHERYVIIFFQSHEAVDYV